MRNARQIVDAPRLGADIGTAGLAVYQEWPSTTRTREWHQEKFASFKAPNPHE